MTTTERSPISFIIPAYNCANFLPAAVDSILEDNIWPNDEIIIVNDASTDDTQLVIDGLIEKNKHVRSLLHPYNKGSAAAGRNTGIGAARNDLIFCLDADNLLVPASVERLKHELININADAATVQEIRYFTKTRSRITHSWLFNEGVITLADALSGHFWPGPSGNYLFTRQSWLDCGRYDESVGGGIDSWAFGIRQLAAGAKMIVVPGVHYLHRYGIDSAYVREERTGSLSLKALPVLIPLLDLIDKDDVDYLLSPAGRATWFENLDKHPIRLRSAEVGITGKRISAPSSMIDRVTRKMCGIYQRLFPRANKSVAKLHI